MACKLSGRLVTAARWDGWTVNELAPYVRRALVWFGERRLCLDRTGRCACVPLRTNGSWTRTAKHLGSVPSDGRARVFGLNAIDFKRLGGD